MTAAPRPVGSERFWLAMALVALGVGWGVTQPLGKIAASTGHPPFGMLFWQLVVSTALLGFIALLRGKGLVLSRKTIGFYVLIAVIGTLIPNTIFYISIARLPSGIMSILISIVPMLAFPLAILVGIDRFSLIRMGGLVLGLIGVGLIAAPGAALPDPAMVAFLPLAIIGPLFYALEATYVARWGMAGMDALQAMFGASLVGLILCLPVVLILGQDYMPQMPPAREDLALFASSALHGLLYAGYVGLAARAGSVFASQCSYIVTGAGVLWAMLLLGERFPPIVFVAMAILLAGVALVQPRMRR